MRADKWGVDVRHAHLLSDRLAVGGSGARGLGACVVCAEWGQDSESVWVGRFWFAGEFVRGALCNDCAGVARGASDSCGGFGLFGGAL